MAQQPNKYSTVEYLHPADFPNHSPFHDVLVAAGLTQVSYSSHLVSPADGIENYYVYEGEITERKLRAALRKVGLAVCRRKRRNKKMTWFDNMPGFPDPGVLHYINPHGAVLRLNHSLSG